MNLRISKTCEDRFIDIFYVCEDGREVLISMMQAYPEHYKNRRGKYLTMLTGMWIENDTVEDVVRVIRGKYKNEVEGYVDYCLKNKPKDFQKDLQKEMMQHETTEEETQNDQTQP